MGRLRPCRLPAHSDVERHQSRWMVRLAKVGHENW